MNKNVAKRASQHGGLPRQHLRDKAKKTHRHDRDKSEGLKEKTPPIQNNQACPVLKRLGKKTNWRQKKRSNPTLAAAAVQALVLSL